MFILTLHTLDIITFFQIFIQKLHLLYENKITYILNRPIIIKSSLCYNKFNAFHIRTSFIITA